MKPADAPLQPPPGAVTAAVDGWHGGVASHRRDWLAEEVPVALVFNGISHAVMLASPGDLEDFAYGFAYSEGLLAHAGEFYGVDACPVADGMELRLEVAAACEMRLKERRRTLAGRTGCGLCGTDSLQQVKRALAPVPTVQVKRQAIARAQQQMRQHQALQRLTGATHAAAWCSLDGEVICAREDIGRHNALDKLIGAMHFAGITAAEGFVGSGFVSITSRASFEMVQKTAVLGAGLLAAVSAPTALAVQVARDCNLVLAGFVRDDDLVAYTYPERLGLEENSDGR